MSSNVDTPNPCLLTPEEQISLLAILKKTIIRLGINDLPTAPPTNPFGASGLGPNLRINGINLDTIQDILTTSNPTFNNLFVNGVLNLHGYGTYWNFETAPGGNLLVTDSVDSFAYIFVDLSTGILQLSGLGGVTINGVKYPTAIALDEILVGNISGNIVTRAAPVVDSVLLWNSSGAGVSWSNVGVNLKLLAGALETIQNIRTTDSPRFAGLGLGVALNGADTLTNNGQLASGARKFIVDANGLPTKSNNVSLVGQGNAIVVAHGSATAQTGAITSLTSYTTLAAGGSFEIGGYIDVTAFTAGTISMTCTYTDPAGNSQTLTIPLVALAGTIGTTVGSATDAQALVTSIRTSGANAITIATTVSLFTGTYNAYAWIKQIA